MDHRHIEIDLMDHHRGIEDLTDLIHPEVAAIGMTADFEIEDDPGVPGDGEGLNGLAIRFTCSRISANSYNNGFLSVSTWLLRYLVCSAHFELF